MSAFRPAHAPAVLIRISLLVIASLALGWNSGVVAAPPACACGCGNTPRPFCAHRCGGKPCTGARASSEGTAATPASTAATCSCGCKGTPRPACAHSCGGNPCTGGALTNSHLMIGQVVENEPASFTLLAPNGNALTGFVVEFDDGQRATTNERGEGKFTPAARRVIAKVPGFTSTPVNVIGKREAGEQRASVPRFLALGSELIVTKNGLFDGQGENSRVHVGEQACSVLAESPSQAVIYVPPTVGTGSKTLLIEDAGRLEQPLSMVNLSMTADRLTLKKGESTTGRIVVEGADASLAGGVLRVQNLSPDTITLQAPGASVRGNTVELRIDPSMVHDGRIELPLQIMAKKAGSFTLLSSISEPNQTAATCSCGCKGTPRPACAHSCGGNPCTGARPLQ